MPTRVSDLDILKEYITGVMGGADHDATSVNEIALALVGAIVWKKDEEPIEVSHEGPTKTILTVRINGVEYVFSHNPKAKRIDMRGLTDGMLIYSFSNKTPVSKIQKVFETL